MLPVSLVPALCVDVHLRPLTLCSETVYSWYYLLMNFAIFATLTWYFDNVIPSENSTTRPFYFFLQPSYWGIRLKKNSFVLNPGLRENLLRV
jgi:hypothetical protein